jgi:hypothetical protein
MSKAKPSDLLERMRTTATRDITPTSPPPADRAAGVPMAAVTPGRRIRFTLDLSPEQHRFLKRFALDAEVDASLVARALLTLLESDAATGGRVRELVRGRP